MNKQSKYKTICIYLGLAVITIAAFQQLRICDFVNYDDPEYVTENQNVNTGVTAKNFIWAFTSGHASNWHPLTWLSHMLDCQLFDLNPKWHHFVNLLLHIINALLLFAVFKQMTASVWPSAFVAATFAIHPLHVCSVAWISERKDVLSTLFWLLTMAAYFRYTKIASLKWYLLTLAAFTLGLMAKPMLVTLPFVLLLLDYWPLGRINTKLKIKISDSGNIAKIIVEKLPFFALSAVSSIITYLVQQKSGAVARMFEISLRSRITNALVSYLAYIEKMIWPRRLAVFYPHLREALPLWHALIAALLLAGVSIAIVRLAQNHKYLIVGWLWYLGTLVPVIGLVQVGEQAMADRYTYIPLTGLFIIIAWGADELTRKLRLRKALLIIASGIILAAMLICTHFQIKYWRNSITLFEHALDITEDNPIVRTYLGIVFSQQGKYDKAVENYRKAIQICPIYEAAYYNLGIALQVQGKNDEAIRNYRRALELKPDYAEAYYNLGTILQAEGRPDEAISCYNRALQIDFNSAESHNNLGNVLLSQGKFDEALKHYLAAEKIKPDYPDIQYNLGNMFLTQGSFDKAVSHYRHALRLRPHDAEAYYKLGKAFQSQGKYDEAIKQFYQSLQNRPGYAEAHKSIADLLSEMGKSGVAMEHYYKALETEPNNAAIHNNLGIILGAQNRLDEAIVHFQKVLEFSPGNAEAYNNLGIALGQADRFDEAVDCYRKAIQLKPDWPLPMNGLAKILATHPDMNKRNAAEAVKLAERAAELTGYQNAIILDTLATAYASTGRFEKAASAAGKALGLVSAANDAELAERIRRQIETYKAKLKRPGE